MVNTKSAKELGRLAGGVRIRKAYEKWRQTEGVSLASGVSIKIGRYFMRF